MKFRATLTEDKESILTAKGFAANNDYDAACKYAERYDNGECALLNGETLDVSVQCVETEAITRWECYGEMAAHYMANPKNGAKNGNV